MIVNRHQTFSVKPIELYNYVKAIELVTCIGGGYYAGCNFQIML